jgi:hypothetical protein
MKTLYLIDAIDRDGTEDPVYLDKLETIANGRIVFSLGERGRLLSSKHKNRIFGICFWKFIKGFYYIKPWEEFLGFPISPNGTTWVEDACPDTHCNTSVFRDPRIAKIYCPSCKRYYSKPYKKIIDTSVFNKYIEKIKKSDFCQACGKRDPIWKSEDTQLCSECFPKYGDTSFTCFNHGTKIPIPAEIILSAARGEN